MRVFQIIGVALLSTTVTAGSALAQVTPVEPMPTPGAPIDPVAPPTADPAPVVETLPPADDVDPSDAPTVAPDEPKKKKDKKDKKEQPAEDAAADSGGGSADVLEFGGRVYVRDSLSGVDTGSDTTWLEDRTIDSARAFIVFRPNKRTRMDLEVELAGDQVELKDTFIRYQALSFLDLTVGRFKRPVSFIGLASTWNLPRIDRGLLSELRLDERRLLFAGGRGDGISARVELPGAMKPELTFTVHQSELADDLGLPVTDINQDLLARFEIEPLDGLHLAVAGGWMGNLRVQADPEEYRHRSFGTVEGFYESDALRVWLEGMGGSNANLYVGGALRGRFLAAQGLVAPRLERVGPLRALEPFAAVGWYEPSTDQAGDQLTELTGGVAIWISGKLRLQLEGGRRLAQDTAAPSADATLVRVQLGVAFKSETELK